MLGEKEKQNLIESLEQE